MRLEVRTRPRHGRAAQRDIEVVLKSGEVLFMRDRWLEDRSVSVFRRLLEVAADFGQHRLVDAEDHAAACLLEGSP